MIAKIICSSIDVFRNSFILQRAVVGIFYSSTSLHLTKYWCVELDFLIQPVIFIHEFCDKMSNRNILDPDEDNRQLMAWLWDAMKWKGDGKCYFPCTQCRGFKRRRILISTATKHCREHGHTEGGKRISSICRFSIIKFIIFVFFGNLYYFYFSYINV